LEIAEPIYSTSAEACQATRTHVLVCDRFVLCKQL
jgi:hypothetical protein